jgi:hypothetical protein
LLVDIILNEREIMESEIIPFGIQFPDAVIQPDVTHFQVRQYQAQEIKARTKAARFQISYIYKLLAPRPRKIQCD